MWVLLIFLCLLPFALLIYKALSYVFMFIALPVIDFIERIFGEGIFEKTGMFLNIAIWALGIILTIVIGVIAIITF